jgi:hypothetical protein
MDGPTRWCENDTAKETHLRGLLCPSGSPSFFPLAEAGVPVSQTGASSGSIEIVRRARIVLFVMTPTYVSSCRGTK